MKAQARKLLVYLGETFWLLPAAMVTAAGLMAVGLVALDRGSIVPEWMVQNAWLYNGGGTGARTLLGAVASSAIGVAGTVFSITIASLSLAAGQMGPRLLRNFVRDRGNQFTLGAFLSTFTYALMVLRSVRTHDEGAFVPHLALSVGMLMAFLCVATLVFFVGHMASRINVDTVITLVSKDVHAALRRLTTEEPARRPPPAEFWRAATAVRDTRSGYLQELDAEGLATWAAEHDVALRLMVRPGDYVFPGGTVALAARHVDGIEDAVRDATALGDRRLSSADLEFAIRQLVEVAVRALSPGINDPHTAMSVLDDLGAALCTLSRLYLKSGVWVREEKVVLMVPSTDYDGLLDAMFHMIRQNGASSPAVLIRMLEVLAIVSDCEPDEARRAGLRRHADLVLADAERAVPNAADLQDVRERHARLVALPLFGPLALTGALKLREQAA